MARKLRKQEAAPRAAPSFGNLKTSLKITIGMIVGGGIVTWIFLMKALG